MKCEHGALSLVAWTLLIIGGLNWGLVGIFQFDLVQYLFGAEGLIAMPVIAQVVYILVGLAALVAIFHKATCK